MLQLLRKVRLYKRNRSATSCMVCTISASLTSAILVDARAENGKRARSESPRAIHRPSWWLPRRVQDVRRQAIAPASSAFAGSQPMTEISGRSDFGRDGGGRKEDPPPETGAQINIEVGNLFQKFEAPPCPVPRSRGHHRRDEPAPRPSGVQTSAAGTGAFKRRLAEYDFGSVGFNGSNFYLGSVMRHNNPCSNAAQFCGPARARRRGCRRNE